MKPKNYKQKREELKKEKREGMKEDFDDIKQRKKFKEGINRSFRALKRSEKQEINKNINQIVFGDPNEDIVPDMFE